MTANVCFNSSWALFPSQFSDQSTKKHLIDEFCPSSFYGKSCQVEREEHKLLRNLRKWVKENFATKQVLSNEYIIPLDKAATYGAPKEEEGNKFHDFDLMGKII